MAKKETTKPSGAMAKDPKGKAPAKPPTKKKPTSAQKIKTGDVRIGTRLAQEIPEFLQQIGQFDPRTFQQQYEPQFEQGMQRAYDTIYNEFNRRNEQEFAKQNEQLQLSLAERGLDPNSPAYQALTKQLAQQQNDARQNAQSQAWQAAQGYQQQGYQQATGTALLPGQVMQPMQQLYEQQYGGRLTGQQLAQKYQYDRKLQELIGKQQMAQVGAQTAVERDRIAAQIMGGYGNQQPQPNPWNTAIAGAATGLGAGTSNALLR